MDISKHYRSEHQEYDIQHLKNRDDELGFVVSNFHEFCCGQFDEEEGQEDMLANTKICKCGITKADHQKDRRGFLSTKESVYCGKLWRNRLAGVRYVQVANSDSQQKILEYFWKYWKIEDAGLVISVVGDEIPAKLKRSFQSKLVQFSRDAEAMVITSGLNEGITKSVNMVFSKMDESYKQRKVPVIGLSPWNLIKDKITLKADPKTFNRLFKRSTRSQNPSGEDIPTRGNTRLCNGLSYHMFVDFPHDQHGYYSEDNVGEYIENVMYYRHTIEKKLMELNEDEHADGYQQLSAPVVIVLAGGNESTLTYIDHALKAKLPVLVIKGTAGLAGFIANVNNPKMELDSLKEDFFQYISVWKKYTKEEKNKISCQLDELSNILQNECEDCFAVCDLEKEVDFNNKILTVLLNSSTAHPKRLSKIMSLAVEWNMLKNEQVQQLLTKHLDDCDTDQFHETLLTAITTRENRLDWIEELIGKEIAVVDFNNFIGKHLHLLYERACFDYGMTIWEDIAPPYLTGEEKYIGEVKAISKRSFIAKVLRKLFDRYEDDFVVTEATQMAMNKSLFYERDIRMPDPPGNFKYPYKHLLIWAVVFLRSDIAKFAWRMIRQEPLQSAIAMCHLMETMKSQIDDRFEEEKRQLEQNKKMFEDLAIQLLSACNVGDENLTQLLLCSPSSVWGGLSVLQMAASGKVTNFMAAQAVQKYMDDIWNGGVFVDVKRMVLLQVLPIFVATPVMKVRVPYILQKTDGLDETYGRKGGSSFLKRTSQKFRLYFSSPRTKFFYHNLTYFIFLGVFVYMVLVDFKKEYITILESVCLAWILTLQVDELYTLGIFPTANWRATIRDLVGLTTLVESLNAVLFVCGYCVHYLEPEQTFTKVAYSINLVIFQLKIFRAYVVDQTLGPQVVMVKEMTASMLQFLLILLIFIMAYGTSSQALLYTERQPTWNIIRDVFYQPYWIVYGDVGLDTIEDDQECTDDPKFCRKQNALVYFFLAIYILLSNVLLLNLLIAIFSNIYNVIFEKTSAIWRYNMYFLTYEYRLKTVFVPPFSILIHILIFLRYVFCCGCRKSTLRREFTLSDNDYDRVHRMQTEERKNMFQKELKETQTSLTMQIQKIASRLDKIEECLSFDHKEMAGTLKLDRHNSKRSLKGPSHAIVFTTMKPDSMGKQATSEDLQDESENKNTFNQTEIDDAMANERKLKRIERKSVRNRERLASEEVDVRTTDTLALEEKYMRPNVLGENNAPLSNQEQREPERIMETERNKEESVHRKKKNKIEPEHISTNTYGFGSKKKPKETNALLSSLADEILSTFEYKEPKSRKKKKKEKSKDKNKNAEGFSIHENVLNVSDATPTTAENSIDFKVKNLDLPGTREKSFRRSTVRRTGRDDVSVRMAALHAKDSNSKDMSKVRGISPYLSSSDNENMA